MTIESSIKLYSTKKGLTMMNFIEIAKKRCSVRSYSDKKVEKEKLDKILQAAHFSRNSRKFTAGAFNHSRK